MVLWLWVEDQGCFPKNSAPDNDTSGARDRTVSKDLGWADK